MALQTSEIREIKAELGYNVLAVGAEPYIGVTSMFEQVVQPYTTAGASTTSVTTVAAAATPTPVALTLASVTGVAAGDRIVVDVDSRQERATVQAVSGATVTVLLSLAHTGTYPVTVEGGESLIRDSLVRLRSVAAKMGDALANAGIKRVDEVEFFEGAARNGNATFTALQKAREYYRDELAARIGCVRLNAAGNGGNAGAISLW